MAKQKKRAQYVSKGIVGNPSKTGRTPTQRVFDKLAAWKARKPVKISVPSAANPSIMERVPAVSVWGEPYKKVTTNAEATEE